MAPLPLYTVTVGGAAAPDGDPEAAAAAAAGTAAAAGQGGPGRPVQGGAVTATAVGHGGLALGMPVLAHGQLVVGTAVGSGLPLTMAHRALRVALNRSGSCPQPLGDEEEWAADVEPGNAGHSPALQTNTFGMRAGAGPEVRAEAGVSDRGSDCLQAEQGHTAGAEEGSVRYERDIIRASAGAAGPDTGPAGAEGAVALGAAAAGEQASSARTASGRPTCSG